MRKLILVFALFAAIANGYAQSSGMAPSAATSSPLAGQHRIVFQLATDDSLVHKMLMKQLGNILTVAPDTKIEVVCHGPGLAMLMKGKTTVQEKIRSFIQKDIRFLACEFAMKDKQISKEQMIAEAGYVPAGIIAIVTRQEEGWSYIKAGF